MSETISLDLPASHQYLSVLSEAIGEMLVRSGYDAAAQAAYNIQLAVQEACANVVDHAYGGQSSKRIHVTLKLCREPSQFVVHLVDSGVPYDPALKPELDFDQPSGSGGYGLFLIEQLMDSVRYTRLQDGNHWILTKNLPEMI